MEIINDFFEWLYNCITAIPSSIVTSFLISILSFPITRLIKNIKSFNITSIHTFEKIKHLVHKPSPKIKIDYTIIPSPNYSLNKKKGRKKKSNSISNKNDILIYYIIIAFLLIYTFIILKKHVFIVQFIVACISMFFLILPIILGLISTIFNRIQSSTLKFCLFSSITSLFTYYNASILPNLVSQIPEIEIITLFHFITEDTLLPSAYMLLGLFVLILEIIINILLFIRMCIIKIDSICSYSFTRFFIAYTEFLDNSRFLVLSFILLTMLSFVLTSGIAFKFINT